MDAKHYVGDSIMNAALEAAKELSCSVDDLDYEVVIDEEEREFSEDEYAAEIIVYGVLKSSSGTTMERKDPSTLSEEEFDYIADVTTETIRDVLQYFGVEDSEIDEYEGEDGEIILDIVGSDLAFLIGRHGKILDSLQFLVTSITNKKLGFRIPVTIDVEGYKNRRKEKIKAMARSLADKAVKQKHDICLRPMSPYERRIIHITLKDDNRVETFSEGVDPERSVIIKPL